MKAASIVPRETPHNESSSINRGARLAAAAVIALALIWRLAIAAAMPALARDGVGYCWNARALAEHGVAALRQPEFNQHPLYSLLILGVATAFRSVGLAESPLLWQSAAQVVSLASGVGVVLLCGALTRRIVRALDAAADPDLPAVLAMLLAALLPLNIWLSADVMSEQVFLCGYLGAACLLLDLAHARVALAFGVLVGAAFLARPEGAALGLAGGVALLYGLRGTNIRRVALAAVLMALGFMAVAGPYWAALGRFSPKDEKQTVDEFVPAVTSRFVSVPSHAALRYERRELYEALPLAVYETIRGGRLVIPLLALGSLIPLRRRLLKMPLLPFTTAAAAHLSLITVLLNRHGYLDPRHTLVLVVLLIPPAAVFLGQLAQMLRARRMPIAAAILWMAALGPLAWYSLRVPQATSGYIRDAALWIRRQPAVDRSAILVGGSSQRRIAFYADVSFRPWEENARSQDEKLASLADHLGTWQPAARFFAIEIEPAAPAGHERFGNAELLESLSRDSRVARRIAAQQSFPIAQNAELRLIELHE